MSKSYFIALLALTAVTSAFAGTGKPGELLPAEKIDLETMRHRCENPKMFPQQIQPQHLRIQCTDVRRLWVAADPLSELNLPGLRRVSTAVLSDKWYVDDDRDRRELPLVTKPGTCQRFKEVIETVTIERPLSCAELVGIKGDLSDFCLSALDVAKGANPKLGAGNVVDTGNVIDTCGPAGHPVPGKGGK